ncbi:protein-L-isoaspartate(D-aspartate) O-methyltransferase [Nocardiopsis sp. CNR-923]|uniref:protein-L-isoaspartate O-methyltransferase family protein n=1 Tax=Nocardiopsis sp. CNR-923 TaxID=1904965 RepID=UPI000969A3B8|nr:methyltransferase domain-containing protein [Nocardiopsis sp. CNR-923]OLT30663.1 protein-L-isoaspartate(D-aspartate) O-methyltransferase [Nocardiopsis sp. CNR-923]
MHAQLVAKLDTTDTIRAAFANHPRHLYIPDMVWPDITGLPLLRTADPDRWACVVYTDGAVTTQANDGGSGPRNEPSSSSSAPQLMADMISAANIEPGMRVLEIGTGSGWNAAILSSLVGPTGHVTTVEIDADMAAHARVRLAGTGVRVVTGTMPSDADVFDAVIATCAVSRVPPEWIARIELGSLIVTPWAADSNWQRTPVAALRKTGPSCVSGPFVSDAMFMHDRTQRVPDGDFPGLGRRPETTGVMPFTSGDLVERGLITRLMLMLPGVRVGVGVRPFNGAIGRIVYLGADDSSWAYLWPDGSITSGGRLSLVDRLRNAYQWLSEAGWPELDAFCLEADPPNKVHRVEVGSLGVWEHTC